MKPTKQLEKEILKVYDTWMHAYLNADVATYNSYFHDDYHFIGSTNNEEFLSRKDTTKFFELTGEQFAGITDLKNESKILEKFDELIFITHFFDAWFLNEEQWSYYGRFRFSSVMKPTDEGWRFIYQHFSMPDSKSDEGQSIGFDNVKTENIALKEAIKRRTQELELKNRELAIEAALEKVRSRTMAMQKSEELSETSFLLDIQVRELGINTWGCAFNVYGEEESTEWFGNEKGELNTYKVPRIGVFKDYYDKGRQGETLFIREFSGNECIEHYEFMSTLPGIGDVLKQLKKTNNGFPTYQIDHVVFFKYGYLLFITREPVPEAHEIFKRFASVFEQTYTRFLDLQKAEAQAREAQIETALERVRSQSLAMHSTSEMQLVANEVSHQLRGLGLELDAVGMSGAIYLEKGYDVWLGGSNATKPLRIPFNDDTLVQREYNEVLKSRPELFAKTYSGKVKKEYIDKLLTHGEFSEELKNMMINSTAFSTSIATTKNSGIQIVRYSPAAYSEEENDILKRFAKVFEQAYIRFMDLEKAEAQARESEIELALERVRARSMGMQKSEELKEVIKLVYDQFIHLNIHIDHAGFIVDYKPKRDWHFWIADKQEIPSKITHPYFDSVWANQFDEAKEKGRDFFATNLNFEEKNKFYKVLLNLIPGLSEEAKDFYFSCPGLAGSTVLLENVGLYIENFDCIPYSNDENATLMRFGKVFQQTYTRFLDLQRAEAQARESQIEAALERVRSQTMGMQTSEDLSNVTTAMFEQLRLLGGELYSAGIVLCNKHENHVEQWHSVPGGGMLKPFIVPINLDRIHQYRYDQWKKGTELFSIEIPEDFIENHFETMFNLPSVKAVLADFATKDIPMPETPTWEIDYGASFKYGYLLISALQSFKEADILPRFAKVFEQTYTRFLDLQRAEAQARESEIELALERVRARTMAMQHSDELQEAAVLMFKQVENLGVSVFGCGFNIWDEDRKAATSWMAGKDRLQPSFKTSSSKDIFRRIHKAAQKGETLFVEEQSGKALKAHYKYMASIPEFKKVAEKMAASGLLLPNFQIMHCAFFSQGYLMFISFEPAKDAHDIFKRFAKVFEQTYTRFIDLKKAEAQAKEAKIEAALEKVRSRTMAMQKGEEVKDVVVLLYKELIKLGVTNFATCGYVEINEATNRQATWVTNPGGDSLGLFHLPLTGDATFDERYKAWKNQQLVFHQSVAGKIRKKHLEYAITTFNSKEAEEMVMQQFPDPTVFYCFNFSHGYLHLVSGSHMTREEETLLARFTKVFEQTYTRFLDLQKAEAQTREVQIENALEKVRSRTMAMQKSEELPDAANVLFHQVQSLGIPAWSAGYNILAADKKSSTCIMSSEGEIQVPFVLPLTEHSSLLPWYKAIKNGLDFFVYEQGGDELVEHYNYMATIPGLEQVFQQFKDADISVPTHQINHLVRFTNGFLLFITYESVPDAHDIFKRFGHVFEQTYTRFLDLQKAEAQALQAEEDLINLQKAKKKAEDTLSELQETQKQLIQSEKMASLGELTAGIAHEIQNPLNFVNNFSEVSKELLEEMMEELANGDIEEVKEIANDIIQNLEKINHHGKRADGIVKGMLQHSRSSSGVKEPTDINALADEYLRLAYHGLRAKDKSFNATLETDFDESVDTINIISQDIGRVILNLITNAFYVVDEKKNASTNATKEVSYEPTVSVSTKKLKGNVLISVKDNGNGIPQKVLDKIFQPFFTTKPTGQGTGLGLSLSYDIVKSHGGEIKLNTKENEGTEFTIVLPI